MTSSRTVLAVLCVAVCYGSAAASLAAGSGAAAGGAESRFFWQLMCENGGCNEGCTQTSLPTNRCLQMQGGASGEAYCDYTANNLVINQYILSPNCTGAYEVVRSSLMQCYPADSGNYVEYMCPPPNKAGGGKHGGHEDRHHHHHHGQTEDAAVLVARRR
jgi:hypothetical protein